MADTNGTVEGVNGAAGGEGEGVVNRLPAGKGGKAGKAAPTPAPKLGRLWALVGRAERKTFSVKREEQGHTFALRMDGLPETVDADGVAELARRVGAKVSVTVPIGESAGRAGGTVHGETAGEMVKEMTSR